jgi:ParB family chromosome partitioning protein
VAAGVLSAGHARALLAIDAPEEIEAMADRVIAEGLSVRSTEELARLRSRRPGNQVPRRRRRAATTSALGEKLAATLSDRYDTRVTVTEGASKGRIVIEFAGGEDLARLAEILLDEDR